MDESKERSHLSGSVLLSKIWRFSAHDGPGIRTTVYLKGCPLKCAWCHNPECSNPYEEIYHKTDKCTVCGKCAERCPENAIHLANTSNDTDVGAAIGHLDSQELNKSGATGEAISLPTIRPAQIDRSKCTRCMECADVCKSGAITKVGTRMLFEDVLKEIKSDEVFFRTSNGGVTVSGGEPLLFPEITMKLLKSIKDLGIHTALDTSGFAEWNAVKNVLKHVDLVLLDIKTFDNEKHVKWTGVANSIILDNAKKMANENINIRLRLPIIHNVNYWDLEHARNTVDFARQLGSCLSGIDILPFHSFADSKYKWLGLENAFKGFPDIMEEDVRDYSELISKHVSCEVVVGGMVGVKEP